VESVDDENGVSLIQDDNEMNLDLVDDKRKKPARSGKGKNKVTGFKVDSDARGSKGKKIYNYFVPVEETEQSQAKRNATYEESEGKEKSELMGVTRPQKRRRKNTKVELATQNDEASEETAKTDKDPELKATKSPKRSKRKNKTLDQDEEIPTPDEGENESDPEINDGRGKREKRKAIDPDPEKRRKRPRRAASYSKSYVELSEMSDA
jgi:hypothetical protein